MLLPVAVNLRRRIASIPLFWVITIPLAVSAVGALAGVGYLAHRNGQVAVEGLGKQLVTQTNALINREITSYLEVPLLINQLNVDNVQQGRLDLQDMAALEELLFQRLQQFDQMTTILFAAPDGTFRVVERFPTWKAAVAEPSQPGRLTQYHLNPDGSRGLQLDIATGFDVRRDRPWYQQAVTHGGPVWSPIAQHGPSDYLTLTASQPVYDPTTGALLGVFAVQTRLGYLSEILQQFSLSQGSRILVADPTGTLVATSTGEQPYTVIGGSNLRKQFQRQTLTTSQDELVRALGEQLHTLESQPQNRPNHPATRPAISLAQPPLTIAPVPHTFSFRHQNQRQFVKILPIQDAYGLDWRMITMVPEAHFLGDLERHQQQATLLWLLSLGGALGVGLLAAKLLLRRLAQFTQASQLLAAGDLNQRLATDSPIAELNGLAQSFNQMVDQLQAAFNKLQTALDESETKFSSIFRFNPDPIAITTFAEGRFLDVNRSELAFFGYHRDEMIGRTALELNLWTDINQRHHYRALLEQHGQVRGLEVQVTTKSGDIRTILLSAKRQSLEGQDCVIVAHQDITVLKQAEARLQQTQRWLRQYSQLSPGNIYTLVSEPDGTMWFEYASAAVETIHEITVDQALADARLILNTFHPDDLPGYEAAAQECLHTLCAFTHQFRIITPSGQVKWLDARSQPEVRANGVIAWHGIAIDITDRKQAAKALQESETRFRQLAETVQEGFFVYEIERDCYSYVNPAYSAILDIPLQELYMGMAHWIARIHPDDRDRIETALAREQHGENFSQEYRYITPEGELRWLRSKAFPLCDTGGQVIRVVGTVENITERKQAETALRQSEERFRRAFDDAPYGISLVSADGRFVKANAYYCNLLGYTEAELLNMTFLDVTYAEDQECDWALFRQMMTGKIPTCQVEKRYITKQGMVIPVQISAAPVYDEAGQPLYSVGHVQDIRERLAVDHMKDEFISIVSHELRTPITAIQGALMLLGARVYDSRPQQANYMLDIAIKNSARLVRLVDDILSFERLESGKVQLEKEACEVASLMYQAVESVQPIADQSGITITLTPLTATLWAAPDEIIQVLTNLLSNAVKFSFSGSTIWLSAEVKGEEAATSLPPYLPTSRPRFLPRTYLLFTVTDQGRGIPADRLDLIFKEFQQVDASDSRKRGGTGLGLAICRRIVMRHQGHIWVKSCLGVGSTFYVALPQGAE